MHMQSMDCPEIADESSTSNTKSQGFKEAYRYGRTRYMFEVW